MLKYPLYFICTNLLILASAIGHEHHSQSSISLPSKISITEDAKYRYIKANGIPNHSIGTFPNRYCPNSLSEQNYDYRVTLTPTKATSVTYYGLQSFGIALNGVALDPAANEYWNNDRNSGWNMNPLSEKSNLGTDGNNAHVQPNGAYHYHAVPEDYLKTMEAKYGLYLFGYAADGFPVYLKYGYNDEGKVIELSSSYQLKNGTRGSGPGGNYDGTYVEDYQYVKGLGDLDECNGRDSTTPEYPEGTYYYVVTENFPYIPRCFRGTPDSSFERKMGRGGPPPGEDRFHRGPPPDGRRPSPTRF